VYEKNWSSLTSRLTLSGLSFTLLLLTPAPATAAPDATDAVLTLVSERITETRTPGAAFALLDDNDIEIHLRRGRPGESRDFTDGVSLGFGGKTRDGHGGTQTGRTGTT
jgi:hypothetical protein